MSENSFRNEISEQQPSLEFLKEDAKRRLNHILYAEVKVESIQSFANDALEEISELISDLLNEYKNNPYLEGDLNLDTQQQEDDLCNKLEIPNIYQVLEQIQEVQHKIERLMTFVEVPKSDAGKIIIPPDNFDQQNVGEGGGAFEKKKLIPRVLTLLYIY
jgi:hypothetical protein